MNRAARLILGQLLCVAAAAQDLAITNTSPLPRRHWTSRYLTIPAAIAEDLPVELTFRADDGRRFRAVLGETIGASTAVRVLAELGGGERVTGELVPEQLPWAIPYRAHAWFADDPGEVIPRARYKLPGVPGEVLIDQEVIPWGRVEASPAHELWRLRSKSVHGVIFDWWAEFLTDDPVAQVWGTIAWSDRSDPGHTRTFTHIVISAGEQLALDWRGRTGMPPPNRERARWGHMVAKDLVLDDGAALGLSGTMLAWPSPEFIHLRLDDLPALEYLVGQRDQLVAAAAGGPVVGVWLGWDGHYGATGSIPTLEHPGDWSATDAAWEAFLAASDLVVGYGAPRELGASRSPSGTGSQEDFGAAKGTAAVTTGDARWIRRAQWALLPELLRRGYHHHDELGMPIEVGDHPGWVTYAGQTFPQLAGDRLGKDFSLPRPWSPATGWAAYDEEHATLNNVSAFLTLTHDPSLLDHVAHMVTVWEADARTKGVGIGAARAQGRTLGALAQLWTVSPIELRQRIEAVISVRLEKIRGNPALTFRPIAVLEHRGPDPRKQIFTDSSRHTFAPWWSAWEHGLAAVGLQQCVRATGMGEDVLRTVCETLGQYGFRQLPDGTWLTVADMAWLDGQPPFGWPQSPADWQVTYGGGVDLWTRAGVLVAREVLGDDHPAAPRIDAYIAGTGGTKTDDRILAEWYAAVRRR